MRLDVPAPALATPRKRAVSVTAFDADVSPYQVLSNTVPIGHSRNLSPYVTGCTQTDLGASVRLLLPPSVDAPAAGSLIQIADGSTVVFNGQIETAASSQTRGADRSVQLTVRRRDAADYWRGVRRVAPWARVYRAGSDLGQIARDVLTYSHLGNLHDSEVDLPDVGVTLAHDQVQLADLTIWEMLSTLLLPGLREPWVDALGRFRSISRNVQREPDIVLEDLSSVITVQASQQIPALTCARVQWTSPVLAEVDQKRRPLATETIGVGFFNPREFREVWWSDDHTQRAHVQSTDLEVVHDSGWGIPAAGFGYSQATDHRLWMDFGDFGARIEAGNPGWQSFSVISQMVAEIAAAIGFEFSIPVFGAYISHAIEAHVLFQIFSLIANQRTVTFRVWGVPFDLVHVVHISDAVDSDAQPWREKIEVIQSSLVPCEDVAKSLAVGELRYRLSAAHQDKVVMVDDYRIEVGDLIGFPGGASFYVTGYSRELTRGAPAHLELGGFFVGGAYKLVKKW